MGSRFNIYRSQRCKFALSIGKSRTIIGLPSDQRDIFIMMKAFDIRPHNKIMTLFMHRFFYFFELSSNFSSMMVVFCDSAW